MQSLSEPILRRCIDHGHAIEQAAISTVYRVPVWIHGGAWFSNSVVQLQVPEVPDRQQRGRIDSDAQESRRSTPT